MNNLTKMSESFSDNIYRQQIIELYRNPENFGSLENATHSASLDNPVCGDEINVYLVVEENKVKDVKFKGNGCAISMASASLLTEKIKGMDVEDVKNLSKDDLLELLGIRLNPSRIKCVLLSLDAVKEALKNG